MTKAYVPRRGEAVWISMMPGGKGREQSGHRPALVLSGQAYNRKVGLAVCCPITGRIKGYPFEVPVPEKMKVAGAILADQIKTLDWRERKAKFICRLPEETVSEVFEKVIVLLGPEEE